MEETFECFEYWVYNQWLVQELLLCFEQIRYLADIFPFWQRVKTTGRKPMEERSLLISYLVKAFFNYTFRQTEGILQQLQGYFNIENIPHHSVMSKKNRGRRWQHLWKRFFKFVLKLFPNRKIIAGTDATGYSGRKEHWNQVDYDVRANQNWVKAHTVFETDSFIILNYELTR